MERVNTRLRPGSWSAVHPNEGDDERWKGSPTTETSADEGTNARIADEHARDENTPASPKRRSARPGGRSRRRATRH